MSPEPPTPSGRVDRRRARTRAALIDAAEIAFREGGYAGTRIEDVAERADVSVGSVYTHFHGKHGLYLAVVERALELFAGYMERSNTEAFTPLQRVLAGGDSYLRFHLEHPGAFQFLALRAAPPSDTFDSAAEDRIRDGVDRLLTEFADRIDAAVAAGEARPVDSLRLTTFLWGAWNGVISLRMQPKGLALDDDEIAETLEVGRWLLREALASPAMRNDRGEVDDRVPMPFVGPDGDS